MLTHSPGATVKYIKHVKISEMIFNLMTFSVVCLQKDLCSSDLFVNKQLKLYLYFSLLHLVQTENGSVYILFEQATSFTGGVTFYQILCTARAADSSKEQRRSIFGRKKNRFHFRRALHLTAEWHQQQFIVVIINLSLLAEILKTRTSFLNITFFPRSDTRLYVLHSQVEEIRMCMQAIRYVCKTVRYMIESCIFTVP